MNDVLPDGAADHPQRTAKPRVLDYYDRAADLQATQVIRRCDTAAEAELYRGVLSAAGIDVEVIDQHTEALGPYSGGAAVKLIVCATDAPRAAEALRHATADDVEPIDDPSPADAAGQPLVVAAAFDHPRPLRQAAATLASAHIDVYLPTLVPRGDRQPGAGKRFLLRVAEANLERAQVVLNEAAAEDGDDEPRCPKCRSWRVHKTGRGLVDAFARLLGFTGEPERFECLACRYRGLAREFFRWCNVAQE